MSFISSFSIASILNQTVQTGKNTLATDAEELSTGTYADVGLTLGAQTGQDVTLRSQESLLQTIETSNSAASTALSSTSTILSSTQSTAQDFLNTLLQSSDSSTSAQTVQQSALTNLQGLIGQLNTNVDGQYIFGGINSSVAPMTDATSTVTSAFTSYLGSIGATASTITSAQMQTFLTGSAPGDLPALFTGSTGSPPNGWATNWSSASDTPTVSQITPSQTVVTSVSANQPALQQLTQAYAMMSSLDTTNLNASAYQTVVNSAEGLVQQAITGLTGLGATVGTAQSAITSANNFMSTQMSTLSTQIGNLENVNTYAVDTQESDLQTQIETAYELTSQLQQLSLTKYLPA